jgi:hypothetical protein
MSAAIRKPSLPPGTTWMLRCMESPGAKHSGKWLQTVGWSIEWGDEPSLVSPVFHRDNIEDDFHWGLYERWTSAWATEQFMSCALVEVVKNATGWRSTGRMRPHVHLPELTHYLCRDERNAWIRDTRPPNAIELGARAADVLRALDKSDWFRERRPRDCPACAEMDEVLDGLSKLRTRGVRRSGTRQDYEHDVRDAEAAYAANPSSKSNLDLWAAKDALRRHFPDPEPMYCAQCAHRMAVDGSGVSRHLYDDGTRDHDSDADHVPYADRDPDGDPDIDPPSY